MLTVTLAELYGFEGSAAAKVFMVGFAALAFVAALMIRLGFMYWLMIGALFFTSLTAPLNYERTAYLPTWLLPLQKIRAEGHLAFGILLTLVVVLTGQIRMHRVPAQGMFLLAITLYAGFLQFFHEGPTEAIQSIGFALATIPCMLFAAPSVCRDYPGCVKVIRAIMVVSVAWAVCSSIQFVINPRYVVNTQGRFWGVLANAQGAAMFVAPSAIMAIWLLLNDTTRRLRPLWIALIAINLLFTGWTGSRTGVLMILVGGAFVLYNRIGRFVLMLPIAAVVFVLLAFLSDELQIQSNLDRLTSTENTRTGVWAAQIQTIAESPLAGVGWKESGGSESSWLGGFASYGIGMFLLMMAFILFSMYRCAHLWVRRARLPREQRPLIDMFISWNAMYFAAATFEGIVLGRSSTTQTTLLMFGAVGVWLTEQLSPLAHATDEHAGDFDAPTTLVDAHAAGDYGFDQELDGYTHRTA